MLKELFNLIKGRNAGRQQQNEISISKAIYKGVVNDLKKYGDRRYDYIIKKVKSLKWGFDIPDDVIFYITDETLKGRRSKNMAKEILDKMPNVSLEETESLTATIASIQSTLITRLRAEDIDLKWYSWETSEDSNVRKSHRIMRRVLVNWDDPPSPEQLAGEEFIGYYHAGECKDCRCFPAPLISIDRLKWPQKVHMNGKIVKMNKTQFKKLWQGKHH